MTSEHDRQREAQLAAPAAEYADMSREIATLRARVAELEAATFKMPPFMRCAVTVYVVSDATGAALAIEYGGAKGFSPASFDTALAWTIEAANSMLGTTDARGMTEQEVSEAIREQEEGDEQDHDGT